MVLARKLAIGDTIGVVGVSNSLKLNNNYDKFKKALAFFENKGFKVKLAKNVFKDYYGSAGTKEERSKELMDMFLDEQVKVIICLTGGQTANTILDLLDYNVIKNNPKIFMGYSDITVLLQAIYKETGLITFHGPNFIDFGGDYAYENYLEFEKVFINKEKGKFVLGDKQIIRKGNISGKLLGTNLGCMMYLIGTRYFSDMKRKILAIESYLTSPNECHRRFSHLKQVGIFEEINGIIIGYNYDLQRQGNNFPQMEDILYEYVSEYNFPIIKCNDFGHMVPNSIIPIGANISINTDYKKIDIIDEYVTD